MIRILLSLVLILTLGCNNHNNLFSKIPLLEDARLDERARKGMMLSYKDCRGECEDYKEIKIRKGLKQAITEAIERDGKKVLQWDWLHARYREEDEERYARLNKFDFTTDRADNLRDRKSSEVRGFTTEILRVTLTDGDSYFFDATAVCPPPYTPDCPNLNDGRFEDID